MPPVTRTAHAGAREPPPLRRVSAMCAVRFTPNGRRLARKLCLDDVGTYYHYFVTQPNGARIHNLSKDRPWNNDSVWIPEELVPDHVVV